MSFNSGNFRTDKDYPRFTTQESAKGPPPTPEEKLFSDFAGSLFDWAAEHVISQAPGGKFVLKGREFVCNVLERRESEPDASTAKIIAESGFYFATKHGLDTAIDVALGGFLPKTGTFVEFVVTFHKNFASSVAGNVELREQVERKFNEEYTKWDPNSRKELRDFLSISEVFYDGLDFDALSPLAARHLDLKRSELSQKYPEVDLHNIPLSLREIYARKVAVDRFVEDDAIYTFSDTLSKGVSKAAWAGITTAFSTFINEPLPKTAAEVELQQRLGKADLDVKSKIQSDPESYLKGNKSLFGTKMEDTANKTDQAAEDALPKEQDAPKGPDPVFEEMKNAADGLKDARVTPEQKERLDMANEELKKQEEEAKKRAEEAKSSAENKKEKPVQDTKLKAAIGVIKAAALGVSYAISNAENSEAIAREGRRVERELAELGFRVKTDFNRYVESKCTATAALKAVQQNLMDQCHASCSTHHENLRLLRHTYEENLRTVKLADANLGRLDASSLQVERHIQNISKGLQKLSKTPTELKIAQGLDVAFSFAEAFATDPFTKGLFMVASKVASVGHQTLSHLHNRRVNALRERATDAQSVLNRIHAQRYAHKQLKDASMNQLSAWVDHLWETPGFVSPKEVGAKARELCDIYKNDKKKLEKKLAEEQKYLAELRELRGKVGASDKKSERTSRLEVVTFVTAPGLIEAQKSLISQMAEKRNELEEDIRKLNCKAEVIKTHGDRLQRMYNHHKRYQDEAPGVVEKFFTEHFSDSKMDSEEFYAAAVEAYKKAAGSEDLNGKFSEYLLAELKKKGIAPSEEALVNIKVLADSMTKEEGDKLLRKYYAIVSADISRHVAGIYGPMSHACTTLQILTNTVLNNPLTRDKLNFSELEKKQVNEVFRAIQEGINIAATGHSGWCQLSVLLGENVATLGLLSGTSVLGVGIAAIGITVSALAIAEVFMDWNVEPPNELRQAVQSLSSLVKDTHKEWGNRILFQLEKLKESQLALRREIHLVRSAISTVFQEVSAVKDFSVAGCIGTIFAKSKEIHSKLRALDRNFSLPKDSSVIIDLLRDPENLHAGTREVQNLMCSGAGSFADIAFTTLATVAERFGFAEFGQLSNPYLLEALSQFLVYEYLNSPEVANDVCLETQEISKPLVSFVIEELERVVGFIEYVAEVDVEGRNESTSSGWLQKAIKPLSPYLETGVQISRMPLSYQIRESLKKATSQVQSLLSEKEKEYNEHRFNFKTDDFSTDFCCDFLKLLKKSELKEIELGFSLHNPVMVLSTKAGGFPCVLPEEFINHLTSSIPELVVAQGIQEDGFGILKYEYDFSQVDSGAFEFRLKFNILDFRGSVEQVANVTVLKIDKKDVQNFRKKHLKSLNSKEVDYLLLFTVLYGTRRGVALGRFKEFPGVYHVLSKRPGFSLVYESEKITDLEVSIIARCRGERYWNSLSGDFDSLGWESAWHVDYDYYFNSDNPSTHLSSCLAPIDINSNFNNFNSISSNAFYISEISEWLNDDLKGALTQFTLKYTKVFEQVAAVVCLVKGLFYSDVIEFLLKFYGLPHPSILSAASKRDPNSLIRILDNLGDLVSTSLIFSTKPLRELKGVSAARTRLESHLKALRMVQKGAVLDKGLLACIPEDSSLKSYSCSMKGNLEIDDVLKGVEQLTFSDVIKYQLDVLATAGSPKFDTKKHPTKSDELNVSSLPKFKVIPKGSLTKLSLQAIGRVFRARYAFMPEERLNLYRRNHLAAFNVTTGRPIVVFRRNPVRKNALSVDGYAIAHASSSPLFLLYDDSNTFDELQVKIGTANALLEELKKRRYIK